MNDNVINGDWKGQPINFTFLVRSSWLTATSSHELSDIMPAILSCNEDIFPPYDTANPPFNRRISLIAETISLSFVPKQIIL